MALSVAVPIRFAISSLVKDILMKPSGSVPSFCSNNKRISAKRSRTVFCAKKVIVLEDSPNSKANFCNIT